MLDENKWLQYGFPRSETEIQGITLHEVENFATAEDYEKYLAEVNKSNEALHCICDATESRQLMPFDYAVYHTGKGIDWGNSNTIAIGILSSLNNEKFDASLDNAVALIKEIQNSYGIDNNHIYFHNSFNKLTYCPKTLLDRYGSVIRFVNEKIMEK